MARSRNNCKPSMSRLALLYPGYPRSGEGIAKGRLRDFLPSWLLIPGCWAMTHAVGLTFALWVWMWM